MSEYGRESDYLGRNSLQWRCIELDGVFNSLPEGHAIQKLNTHINLLLP